MPSLFGCFVIDYIFPYFFLIIFSYLFIKYTAVNAFNKRSSSPKSGQTILVMTAHPDDECMFFSPSILSMLEEGHKVHVACLSTGNYYGQGEVRRTELMNSCKELGIHDNRVTAIDNSEFPDDPSVKWNTEKLGHLILSLVEKINPHCILTFDVDGVSGHSNHGDISRAARYLIQTRKLRKDICVYTLDSCSILRKYISLFDVPICAILSYTVFVSSPRQFRQTWRAMSAHRSQLVWFRRLYMMFSRYMIVNTLTELTTTDS